MEEGMVTLNINASGKLEPQVMEEVHDDQQTQLLVPNDGVFYNTIEITTDELSEQIHLQDPNRGLAQGSTADFKFELIAAGADLGSDYHVESIVLDGGDQEYQKNETQEVVIINAEDLQGQSASVEATVQALVHDHNVVKLGRAQKLDKTDVLGSINFGRKLETEDQGISKPKYILSSQFRQDQMSQPFFITSTDGKTYQIAPTNQVIQLSSDGGVSNVSQIGIPTPQMFPQVSTVPALQYVLPGNVNLVRNQMSFQLMNLPSVQLQDSASQNEILAALPTSPKSSLLDLKSSEKTDNLLSKSPVPTTSSILYEADLSTHGTVTTNSVVVPTVEEQSEEIPLNSTSPEEEKVTESSRNTISYVMAADTQNLSTANTINVSVPGMPGVVCQLQRYLYTQGLCRVCLLVKNDLVSIFEDVSITSNGLIENSRGPHAANRYNIIPAIKTLLDVEVNFGDGLPEQICLDCIDNLTSFSVFRKRIAIGQSKLNEILAQVQGSSTPTVIPELGEQDMRKTDVFRHAESIIQAKDILKYSSFSHLVERSLSDRVWEKIFQSLSVMVGFKSGKLKGVETYSIDQPYVNGWFCYSCNVTIHGSRENYRQHCVELHGAKSPEEVLFPCDICATSFTITDGCSVSQSYGEHWLQHFFFYECTECNKRMPSQKGLWVHRRSAHNAGDKIFQCTDCDKSFFKKAHLDAHKKTHLDPEERKRHLNWCKLCGKGLTSSLTAHMTSVHSNDRPWKCEICNKQFKRKEILNGHRETVHFNMKKYQCELCGEFLKSHSTKALHILRHKGEKPHACEVCDKRFYSTHSMKSHMLKHQDVGEVNCTTCGKVFKRKMYLVEHMRLHTGEKPHECHICGKQIRMKSNFFKHLKVHKRREAEKLAKQMEVIS
ncbi:unnamed protein product [Allacma fusca]|uniref:Uncharacterized protein n=1 Tax=Allacma fusca TaxID=39272 RepID=A0A8J2NWW4_9HEXA|nr:unnamed protein product [Allacma fusca]